MSPATSPHASDSEDSTPEVLTLSSTKEASRNRTELITAFQKEQKEKRKRENQARDAALKEAKEGSGERKTGKNIPSSEADSEGRKRRRRDRKHRKKEKGKEKSTETSNAEERMEWAMREAIEEGGSNHEEDTEGSSVEHEEEGWAGLGLDAEDLTLASVNHLPEHLFSAAVPRPSLAQPTAAPLSSGQPPKKKHKKSKAKELIVGSRTLRTILPAHSDTLTASLTLPPARVNKFLKRTLRLKQGAKDGGSKQGHYGKSWERRPVNVGVMRRTGGPALRFARGEDES